MKDTITPLQIRAAKGKEILFEEIKEAFRQFCDDMGVNQSKGLEILLNSYNNKEYYEKLF